MDDLRNSLHPKVFQFVEAPAFSRYRNDYLDDEGFRELQGSLVRNPEAGDLVPGAGGIRKLRWKDSRRGKGNMLRVSPRTVEKWEQGGQVSPLAATFVELVSKYPDTIERLETLPKRVSRPTRVVRRTRTRPKVAQISVTPRQKRFN